MRNFQLKHWRTNKNVYVAFIRLISTHWRALVIVSYGNISIKIEWREYMFIYEI